MANAIVKKYKGVNFPEGQLLYRDQIIDDGFLGVIDFKSQFVTKDYTGVTGSPLNNLIDGKDSAEPFSNMPIVGDGIPQDATDERIFLPEEFKLGAGVAGTQHFIFCQWFKHDSSFSYPSSQDVGLGGWGTNATSGSQYGIYINLNSGTSEPESIKFLGNGKSIDFPDVTPVTDDLIHQFAVEFKATSATTCDVFAYIDGQLVGQLLNETYNGSVNVPGGSNAYIGFLGGFQNQLRGVHYRAWMKDFTQGGENTSAKSIIEKEWALYSGRFA